MMTKARPSDGGFRRGLPLMTLRRPWPHDGATGRASDVVVPRFVAIPESDERLATYWNQIEFGAAGGRLGLGGPHKSEPTASILAHALTLARDLLGSQPIVGDAYFIEPRRRSATKHDALDYITVALGILSELSTGFAPTAEEHGEIPSVSAAKAALAGLVGELAGTPRDSLVPADGSHPSPLGQRLAEGLKRSGFGVELKSTSEDQAVNLYAVRHVTLGCMV